MAGAGDKAYQRGDSMETFETLLIIVCCAIAVVLLVLLVMRILHLLDLLRAYSKEKNAAANAKEEYRYYVDVIQQEGRTRVESREAIRSLDDGSEVGK